MTFSLSRYLNVRRTERPRLAWLYAMLFSSILGGIWGGAVIEAGFLRYVGVQNLPLVIMGSALVSIGIISVYNLFADRIPNDTLLVVILAGAILVIGASVVLLAYGQVMIAFPLLYIANVVIFRDLFNLHWAIYVNGYFETQSAKRVIPVLSSASRLAAIVGGLSMPILTSSLSPTRIIFVMLLMQVVMMTLAVLMRRVLGDYSKTKPVLQQQPKSHGALAHMQEGYRYVASSRFLGWIAIATLLMTVLLAFLNYQSGRILLANLKTVQNIANFTGLLGALGNLVALPLQLFLLSRLIGRTGVGNAALIYPTTSFLAVTGLTLVPSFFTAGFGYLARTVIRTTFYIPVDSLLYNAVPLRIKARARGFISGYVMTTGSLAGGLLLVVLNKVSAIPLLAGFFTLLAVAYLASAFQVKRYYSQAVVAMLEQDDLVSWLAPSSVETVNADDTTLEQLRAKMSQPDASDDFKVFMAQVITQVGGAKAVPILEPFIRQTSQGHLRAKLVEVLAASAVNSAAAEAAFLDSLHDSDVAVRQAALIGLERILVDHPVKLQSLIAPLLSDPELSVRAAVLTALANSRTFTQQPIALPVLDSLLLSDQPELRASGVRILCRLIQDGDLANLEASTFQLLRSLRDSHDEVRLAAVAGLDEIVRQAPDFPSWLSPKVLASLLSDPLERVRQIAVTILGKNSQTEGKTMLLGALRDTSESVRLTAVETIAQLGTESIDLVQPLLESEVPSLRSASAAILGRVDGKRFEAGLLSGFVITHLQAIYHTWGILAALAELKTTPVLDLLLSSLSEWIAQRLDEIFHVLRTIRPAGDIDRIQAGLRNPDPIKRANSLEALEVLTTPLIARLIEAASDQPPDTKRLLRLSSETWGYQVPGCEQAIQELKAAQHDPWISELASMLLPASTYA